MELKSFLLAILASTGLTIATTAQNVPNYVPTEGLLGWWPFNGNANDESGNGNNGTVNGAILTTDRLGSVNSAYQFNGINNMISVNDNQSIRPINSISFCLWFRIFNFSSYSRLMSKRISNTSAPFDSYAMGQSVPGQASPLDVGVATNGQSSGSLYSGTPTINEWNFICITYDGSQTSVYENGMLTGTVNLNGDIIYSNLPLYFGTSSVSGQYLNGELDDIGIWNRALTQQEITSLFNASNCANNTTITPQTNSLSIGSIATFTATTSDPNPSYVWQSDLGQGFQTLSNFGSYSGTSTNILSISNVQLANHNVPIRVISTSEECIDTSDVATISILDTCVTSINDTTFITVTDTLVINTQITGVNPQNNSNTIKIYPNPTNDHITIEYGDFATMNGYQLRIENSIGQEVFQTSITQQSDYLNLNSWGGNGLYFVHIVDPQGNTIDIRKIVLQ